MFLIPVALVIRFVLGAIFVIVADAERAAEVFGHWRPPKKTRLFESIEVREIAQARQSPQGQETRRRHIGMGGARLRATRPGRYKSGAAQSGDHITADGSAENVSEAGTGDRLKIGHRRQRQLLQRSQTDTFRGDANRGSESAGRMYSRDS